MRTQPPDESGGRPIPTGPIKRAAASISTLVPLALHPAVLLAVAGVGLIALLDSGEERVAANYVSMERELAQLRRDQRLISTLPRPDTSAMSSLTIAADTEPSGSAQDRFYHAFHCDSARRGAVRGMLEGRFSNPTLDTVMVGATVGLRERDSHILMTATTGLWGSFSFRRSHPRTFYSVEVYSEISSGRLPYELYEGYIEDLEKKCILPDHDGRLPVSRMRLRILKGDTIGVQ